MFFSRRKSRYRSESYWPEYVPVAERRRQAANHLDKLRKKGELVNPIVIGGRQIASTFWGKAWCNNLEAYSDYANRLPRGRTYVRNGSVLDLQITQGKVNAQVMGSSLYQVAIEIKPMSQEKWSDLVKACTGKIDSLIELLKGKFSQSVMEIITQKEKGLFPKPQEISMRCSCPDHAGMCKHIAAVLYGVGASLDARPEGLFALRHVDHLELIASTQSVDALVQNQGGEHALKDDELSALFGIEMDQTPKKAKNNPTSKPKAIAKKKPVSKPKAAVKKKKQK
ncbi:MAG: SWIM zinc finger family protein [Chlamydiales bacterium]